MDTMKLLRWFLSGALLMRAATSFAQPLATHVPPPAAPVAQKASAAASTVQSSRHDAESWAISRGLPVRTLHHAPTPDRQADRTYVPVRPQDWASFVQTFAGQPNRLILKLGTDGHHMVAVFPGPDGKPVSFFWARPNTPTWLPDWSSLWGTYAADSLANSSVASQKGIVIDLTPAEY